MVVSGLSLIFSVPTDDFVPSNVIDSALLTAMLVHLSMGTPCSSHGKLPLHVYSSPSRKKHSVPNLRSGLYIIGWIQAFSKAKL